MMKLSNLFLLIIVLCAVCVSATPAAAAEGGSESGGSAKIAVRQLDKELLAPGIEYRRYLIGSRALKLSIHIITADMTDSNNFITLLKAHEHSNRLEKLHDMIARFDSSHSDSTVIGAVNASYWRAYSYYPIGTTLYEGEPVELNSKWYTAMIDDKNRIYIDDFSTQGIVKLLYDREFEIDYVNRRNDSSDLVLYNRFRGDSVPVLSTESIEDALHEALADTSFQDSTEVKLDTNLLREQIINESFNSKIEFSMWKVRAQYLTQPTTNKDIPMIVLSIDTGLAVMPENGCILSLGNVLHKQMHIMPGDTLTLRFSTNKHSDKHFMHSVAGTPKLMRNGISKYEGQQQRTRKRFLWKTLPRTGIGTNKDHTKLYLIAAEGTQKWRGIKGCTLENFAYAMKRLKIYNAINLDGGGSTVMVIDNKNVFFKGAPRASRKVSTGIAIGRKAEKKPSPQE